MPEQIHGHREGRLVRGVVRLHHQIELQFVATAFQKGGANESPAMGGHEVDDFGRGMARGKQKIPFVFAVFVVDDDDDFSPLKRGDGLWDGV